jgi:hypothetical protein
MAGRASRRQAASWRGVVAAQLIVSPRGFLKPCDHLENRATTKAVSCGDAGHTVTLGVVRRDWG